MAVELRCPDCRAKLRLKEAPDPGTEIECPECEHVFAAPELDDEERAEPRAKKRHDDGDDRPKKKRPVEDADDEDRPSKKSEGGVATKTKKKRDPKGPKKRRAKKKETNRTLLILLVVGGIIFLATVSGLLLWFFNRKPASYEMMKYIPADSEAAVGLNVGHLHKYPEFYKQVESSFANNAFKKAADALAKAMGTEVNDMLDYMVEGTGKSGSAIVLRTKEEFDPEVLAKLPGAKEYASGGQKYYTITNIKGAGDRVFAPTNRLVVFCPGSIPKGTFEKMLTGNEGNEETLPFRAGALSKRVVRGTYWVFGLASIAKVEPPPKNEQGGSGGEFLTYMVSVVSSSKGMGFKASVGSRSVRFEFVVWCTDSDVASEKYDKFKSSELAKGDDALEPPRYWKDFAQSKVGGDRKITAELLSTISAKTSGELYIIYAECDTKTLMAGVSGIGGKLAGEGAGGGNGGGIVPGDGGDAGGAMP